VIGLICSMHCVLESPFSAMRGGDVALPKLISRGLVAFVLATAIILNVTVTLPSRSSLIIGKPYDAYAGCSHQLLYLPMTFANNCLHKMFSGFLVIFL